MIVTHLSIISLTDIAAHEGTGRIVLYDVIQLLERIA